MGSNEQDPRQPKDLTDLLKFCIQNTSGDDVPGQPNEAGLENDEERKRFLAEALATFTQSPVEQLKKGIEFVNNRLNEIESNQGDPSDGIVSIQDCVENIIVDIVSQVDFANDFYKISGLELVKRLISTRIPKLIICACDIVAETAQNNPNAQNVVTTSGLLLEFLKLVDGSVNLKRTHHQMSLGDAPLGGNEEIDDVHVKALYAVSSLIRENESSLNVFESNDGYKILLKAIQSKTSNHKLRIKSSFLLMTLIQSHPSLLKQIVQLDFLQLILPILVEGHDDSHEHLLSLINFIATENVESRAILARNDLKTILENKVTQLQGKEECLEEINYCKNILKLCFS